MMHRFPFMIRLAPALLFCLLSFYASAQKTTQVEIENADSFEGDEALGKNVSRLLGNVRFRHQGALMFCDSAYLYQETNSLDAFGKIKILQGDSITLTGDFLNYNGNTRQAKVTGKVVMTDGEMTLRSKMLNYNMTLETVEYFDGGTLTDSKNVLTSSKGYYFSKENLAFFKDSVVLTNPEYVINADTLKYQTEKRIAIFEGPTYINSTGEDKTRIYTEKGWYDTVLEKSVFYNTPVITSPGNSLSGDSLVYDNKLMIGNAYKNVTIWDAEQKVIIQGDYGVSNDKNKTALVTSNAVMIKLFEPDSMFLHADTLFAMEDTVSKNKTWMAYHGVRVFKKDLQGKCDSLVYNSADSTLKFYKEPVMWSEANQLTADFMYITIANSEIHELHLVNSAFICSAEDSSRYNQIKGRDMIGSFTENQLNSIRVIGNGQSVYYTRNSKKQFTGVNRADCSDMLILISDSKISSITMINKPDATLYPINELSPQELKLKGFTWLEKDRPASKEDIFR